MRLLFLSLILTAGAWAQATSLTGGGLAVSCTGAKCSPVFTIFSPTADASGLVLVLNPAQPIHLTRLWCAIQGGTNAVVNLDKRSEGALGTAGVALLTADLTVVAAGAVATLGDFSTANCGSTATCALDTHTPVVLTITSVSGTISALNCSLDYTVDKQ